MALMKMAMRALCDPDRYVQQYWSRYSEQGWYLPGDSARRDEDGYIWIIGRIDDVIKVSGYRLGTAEIESALVIVNGCGQKHPLNRFRAANWSCSPGGKDYPRHPQLRGFRSIPRPAPKSPMQQAVQVG